MPKGRVPHVPAPPVDHDYRSFDDCFPRSDGPPHVPNHSYKKMLSPKGEPVTVVFDPGAALVVWQLVEQMARAKWETRNVMAGPAALVRAVESFRRAGRRPGTS